MKPTTAIACLALVAAASAAPTPKQKPGRAMMNWFRDHPVAAAMMGPVGAGISGVAQITHREGKNDNQQPQPVEGQLTKESEQNFADDFGGMAQDPASAAAAKMTTAEKLALEPLDVSTGKNPEEAVAAPADKPNEKPAENDKAEPATQADELDLAGASEGAAEETTDKDATPLDGADADPFGNHF